MVAPSVIERAEVIARAMAADEEAAVEAVPLSATVDPVILAPDDAGAALFRHAGRLIVVVERGVLPPDAVLPEGAESAALPGGLVLTMAPPPAGKWPALERTRGGWRVVTDHTDSAAPIAIVTAADPARLRLEVPLPGGVLAIPDPETGGTLLVGTQRGPAAALEQGRVFAEFRLLPSLRGVVVAPVSDRIALRAGGQAFDVLYSGPADGSLALTDALPAGNGAAARIFDFPAGDTAALHERLKRQMMEAGAAPLLSRGRLRADLAETMLALGLGPEAQAALRVLASDDQRVGRSARVRALSAAAALVAGRLEEARGLDDATLGDSDEIALWRAALAAGEERTFAAGRVAHAAARLLPAYPAALRARLAAPIAEALVGQGARQKALAVLAALPDEPSLVLARVMAQEGAGSPGRVLALYAPLTESRDQRVRALALRRTVEVRRASGALSAADAADALERQILAWRGDALERSLRVRIAGLRQEAGDTRGAITALRDTIHLFPEHAPQLRPQIAPLLAALVADGSGIAPADFVLLIEENADAMPQGAAGIALARLLAGHLRALDLPDRAAGIYERLLPTLEPGDGRTEVGLALAELRVEAGDGNAALAALAASAPDAAPAESVVIARGLAAARAELARGHADAANRILEALPGTEAAVLRAEQALRAGAWEEAKQRLIALLARVAPEGGPIDAVARRVILHCAMAAVRSGDKALLGELASRYATTMDGSESEAAFRALTGAAAQDLEAVPDLAREIAAMRNILASGGALR